MAAFLYLNSGELAQLVERRTVNAIVIGSNPIFTAKLCPLVLKERYHLAVARGSHFQSVNQGHSKGGGYAYE